jgi:hypothetical protein
MASVIHVLMIVLDWGSGEKRYPAKETRSKSN